MVKEFNLNYLQQVLLFSSCQTILQSFQLHFVRPKQINVDKTFVIQGQFLRLSFYVARYHGGSSFSGAAALSLA